MMQHAFDNTTLKPEAWGLSPAGGLPPGGGLPPDFVALSPNGPAAPGWQYLRRRGLSDDHIAQATGRYRLCYDPGGRRLIFPHHACGIVVGWTSRVIDATMFKRYCSFPVDQAQRFVLYDADRVCRPGSCVFICEGPLDAICVWLAGQRIGAASTALFGAWAAPIQHATLLGLRRLYDRMYVMLDADVCGRALALATQLDADLPARGRQTGVIDIGQEYDDPAAMGVDELRRLVEYAAESSEQRISWPMARASLHAARELGGPHVSHPALPGHDDEHDAETPTLKPDTRGLEPEQCP